MADITELLWQQFGVETQEHLDGLDALLNGLDPETVEADQINTMFRSFHSLKGLAAAMGMTAMEGLAHSAESALSPVRDGSRRLDPALVELLVRGVDTLRGMQERAVAERADSDRPDDLMTGFSGLAGEVGGVKTTAGEAQTGQAGRSASAEDARLAAFTDLVCVTIKGLVAAMASSSGDAMRELDDELVRLDGEAGELGLHGFRRRVRALSRAVHRGGPDVALLRDTAVSLETLEEMTGHDAGRRVLLDMVAQKGAGDAGRMCARAAGLLSGELKDEGDPDAAPAAFEAVADRSELLDLARSGRVARLCADVLRRGTLNDALRLLMIDAADAIAAALAVDPPEDLAEDRAQELTAELRKGAGNLIDPMLSDRLEALAVDLDLIGFLTHESAGRLEAAVHDPKRRLIELDVDLESDPAFSERFAQWVSEHGELIGSRIIDVEGRQATRVLVASGLDDDALDSALGTVDPDRNLIAHHICDGREREQRHAQASETKASDQIVRVTSRALDIFMSRVGEMIRIQSGLEDLSHDARLAGAIKNMLYRAREAGLDDGDLGTLFDQWSERLVTLNEDLERTLKLLQSDVLDLRIVPVDTLLQRFPRIARDLARRHEKEVKVVVEGRDARIDKGMVDILADPLTHMIRNAIDHGIELPEQRRAAGKAAQATVTLSAQQQGDRVLIELADDGRGINLERVGRRAVEAGLVAEDVLAQMSDEEKCRLIFAPGFSTAEKVTETSGRGVGMDVVDRAVTRLGGTIHIQTTPGQGARFTMDLPLSAAIQSTVVVEQGQQVFAIPERYVHEVVGYERIEERVRKTGGAPLPVVGLGNLLKIPDGQAMNGERRVVVLTLGRRRLGLAVDRVVNRRDIYIKEPHPGIASIPGIGGVSTLGDGRVVLILDPDGLMRLAYSSGGIAPD